MIQINGEDEWTASVTVTMAAFAATSVSQMNLLFDIVLIWLLVLQRP